MNHFTHRFSLMCEKGIIDSGTNNISLINIMEELSVAIKKSDYQQLNGKDVDKEEFVDIPFLFEIVSFWKNNGHKEKLDVRIDLLAPSGKALNQFYPKFKFDSQNDKLRTTIKVDGVKINKESGVYNYVIHYRNRESEKYKIVATIPLVINFKVE